MVLSAKESVSPYAYDAATIITVETAPILFNPRFAEEQIPADSTDAQAYDTRYEPIRSKFYYQANFIIRL